MVRGPDREVTREDVYETMQTRGIPREPWTASGLAEHLPCSSDTVYNRLRELETQERIKTKKVGAKARIWWIPDTETALRFNGELSLPNGNRDAPIMDVMTSRRDANEPWTTSEIADEIAGETPDTVYHRVRELQDEEFINSKQVGSRARVWWTAESL